MHCNYKFSWPQYTKALKLARSSFLQLATDGGRCSPHRLMSQRSRIEHYLTELALLGREDDGQRKLWERGLKDCPADPLAGMDSNRQRSEKAWLHWLGQPLACSDCPGWRERAHPSAGSPVSGLIVVRSSPSVVCRVDLVFMLFRLFFLGNSPRCSFQRAGPSHFSSVTPPHPLKQLPETWLSSR